MNWRFWRHDEHDHGDPSAPREPEDRKELDAMHQRADELERRLQMLTIDTEIDFHRRVTD